MFLQHICFVWVVCVSGLWPDCMKYITRASAYVLICTHNTTYCWHIFFYIHCFSHSRLFTCANGLCETCYRTIPGKTTHFWLKINLWLKWISNNWVKVSHLILVKQIGFIDVVSHQESISTSVRIMVAFSYVFTPYFLINKSVRCFNGRYFPAYFFYLHLQYRLNIIVLFMYCVFYPLCYFLSLRDFYFVMLYIY